MKQPSRHWTSSLLLLLAFWSNILPFFVCVSADSAAVDLSQPWEEGPLYNQNKAYCAIQSSMAPGLILGWAVVKDGTILAEGYGLDRDRTDLYPAFSVTKGFSTMLIGKMVELQQIAINETLGEIFNQENDWLGVTQSTEKKTVTLEELPTMTGGLSIGPADFFYQETLQQVLNFMEYQPQERGKFNYLGTNHILARIILRRSGRTPLQFVQDHHIFDKMGILKSDFRWEKFGGVEGTAFGLTITPRALAKIGQLFLQNGRASEGDQLIPSDWIDASVADHLTDDTASIHCLAPGYGYQWYVDRKDQDDFLAPMKGLEGAFMALGYNGQIIVVIPSKNTVIAIMSNDETQIYNITFLVTILENLSKLDEKVENTQECGDFSLLSLGFRSRLSFVLGVCKILSNLIF